MKSSVDFDLKSDNEFEFYKNLLELYEEGNELFKHLNVNDDLLDVASGTLDRIDDKAKSTFANIRAYLLKQKFNKVFYQTIAKDSEESFYKDSSMFQLAFLVNAHYLREQFIGKSKSLELKFLMVKIADVFGEMNQYFAIKTAENLKRSASDFYEKISIVESIRPLIIGEISDEDLSEMMDCTTFYRYENGFKPTTPDLDTEEFNLFNINQNHVINIELSSKTLKYISYYFEGDISEAQIEDLSKIQSVFISKDVIENIVESGKNDDWKETIDLKNIQIENHLNIQEFEKDEADQDEQGDEVFESAQSIYKQLESFIIPLLKPNPNKEETVYYRNLVINTTFKLLKQQYTEEDVTDHMLKNITGIFCANMNLLQSEDEHLTSNFRGSYNTYLRKTVENALTKEAFLNS